MHPEFKQYHYTKFSSRLSSIRKTILKAAEGDETKKEPKTKWRNSRAKQLLYKDVKEGRVPLNATDVSGKSTMTLKSIYGMHR